MRKYNNYTRKLSRYSCTGLCTTIILKTSCSSSHKTTKPNIKYSIPMKFIHNKRKTNMSRKVMIINDKWPCVHRSRFQQSDWKWEKTSSEWTWEIVVFISNLRPRTGICGYPEYLFVNYGSKQWNVNQTFNQTTWAYFGHYPRHLLM